MDRFNHVWVRRALMALAVLSVVVWRLSSGSFEKKSDGLENASFYHAGDRRISWEGKDRFLGEVQPILASRCVACHGCTDAPCSAKFTNHELTMRGASQTNPYAVRVGATIFPEARVGAPGFFPTITKSFNTSLMAKFVELGLKNTTDAEQSGGFDMTTLDPMRKKYMVAPKYECPIDVASFEAYAAKNPMAGMPFGMARMADNESRDLLRWIAETSGEGPTQESAILLSSPSRPQVVLAWENFLNQGPSMVERSTLMARYLYEHWFNAHIAFDEMPGEFFRIVRTTEPNGPVWNQPNEIVTQLPTDDPKVPTGKQLYYRFQKVTEVITQKNHVVFELSKNKIQSYEDLFLPRDRQWQVTALPDYSSADPFRNFREIPEDIRHTFMLEHSRFIVDSMVRAPVCVGESATYAIADHFWVYFLKPKFDPSSGAGVKMSKEGFDGLNLDVEAWKPATQVKDRFVKNYKYMIEFEDALRGDLQRRGRTGLSMDDLWFGEPLREGGVLKNRNAWLSITRHDVSTTVQYGIRGGTPQSAWILSYANFERLYYNLVVNFKYWGSTAHKLGTWRSMSHERMDGEDLFLSMLPEEQRKQVRLRWSGGLELGSDLKWLGDYIAPIIKLKTGIDIFAQRTDGAPNTPIKRYIDLYPPQSLRGTPRTGIQLTGAEEEPEIRLERMIRDRMVSAGVSIANDPLNSRADGESIYTPRAGENVATSLPKVTDFASFEKALAMAAADRGVGRYATWLPATSIARVQADNGESRVYTFIGNRAYLSHNLWALSSSDETSPARDPKNDTISVYSGVVGDRPDIFLEIPLTSKPGKDGLIGATEFLNVMMAATRDNQADLYAKVKSDYGVLRNSGKFWAYYDWLHNWMIRHDNSFGPGLVYAGILDLLRYDQPK